MEREKAEAEEAEKVWFKTNVLPTVHVLQAGGIVTYRDLATALNRRRVGTQRGGRWSSKALRRLLGRPGEGAE